MRLSRTVLPLVVLLAATTAFAYDMGELPQRRSGDQLLGWALPAGTDIPETDQWPAAAWFEYNKTQFVIYAKHLAPIDPETNKGKFMIWISVPLQYKQEVEADHEFTAADAYKYLRRAEISTMTPEMYQGPGDRWTTAPGAEPWNSRTDRCVIGVFEPTPGKVMPRAFARHRLQLGRKTMTLGQMKCMCPKYAQGERKPADHFWIMWVSRNERTNVDQWGLPGNSPVPPPPGAIRPLSPVTTDSPFVGAWVDTNANTLTAIYPDGTWVMKAIGRPKVGLRAGNWGVSDDLLVMRTHLASWTQFWLRGVNQDWQAAVAKGARDLSLAWDLSKEGNALVGTHWAFALSFNRKGQLLEFKAWDHPDSSPTQVRWAPALQVYRPIRGQTGALEAPPELQQMLEQMETGGRGGGKYLGPEYEAQTPG